MNLEEEKKRISNREGKHNAGQTGVGMAVKDA